MQFVLIIRRYSMLLLDWGQSAAQPGEEVARTRVFGVRGFSFSNLPNLEGRTCSVGLRLVSNGQGKAADLQNRSALRLLAPNGQW
jgi:hypothetical protein